MLIESIAILDNVFIRVVVQPGLLSLAWFVTAVWAVGQLDRRSRQMELLPNNTEA